MRAWQARWAPDAAVALLIVGSIAAFHGRYMIAERFSFDAKDVFEVTLWLAFIISILGCGRVVYRLAQHAHRRRQRYRASLRDDDTGSLSIEFLLTFPWMYIMFGMVIQWGLIARAKIIVDYAAYRAARSAVTQVESKTWLDGSFVSLYSLNLFEPDDIPPERARRVTESAALILAQLSPKHDSFGRGEWDTMGYGSTRSAAVAMAETGIQRWPYRMKTDAYELRAHWALSELRRDQLGGQGLQLDLELSPLLNVDFSQFGYAAGNYFDVLEDLINEYAEALNMSNPLGSSDGRYCWTIDFFFFEETFCVNLGGNTGDVMSALGLPSPQDMADDLIQEILQPARDAIMTPIMDAVTRLDETFEEMDPGNPLIPREARVQIRYPYKLRVPLVAGLVHPFTEDRSGHRGRFIQVEADVSLQTTGGRAGNPLTLIAGSPVP